MTATVHACPRGDAGLTPCCRRTPFELPRGDRVTEAPERVTCGRTTPVAVDGPLCGAPGLIGTCDLTPGHKDIHSASLPGLPGATIGWDHWKGGKP